MHLALGEYTKLVLLTYSLIIIQNILQHRKTLLCRWDMGTGLKIPILLQLLLLLLLFAGIRFPGLFI